MSHKPSQEQLLAAMQVMDLIYNNVDARRVSLDERRRLDLKDDHFVYGEIAYPTFAKMLDIAKPMPGDVFYDLGCGSGKSVFLAAMLYDFSKALGVELLKPLYDLAAAQIEKFEKQLPLQSEFAGKTFNIDFAHKDLLEQDISDGNIIYINATCFIGDIWEKTKAKLKAELPIGARVLLTTKSLPDDTYQQKFSELLEMSWGPCTINIYEKIV